MSSKNKIRGTVVENETVKAFKKFGHGAVRAWGSNGNALGLPSDVDVLVNNNFKIQCKRKKALPDYLGLSKNVNSVVFREDRGKLYILMELDEFLTFF